MKKLKLKKKYFFLLIVIIIFLILSIYLLFIKANTYSINYKKSGFEIHENFNKNYESYSFSVNYKKKNYLYQTNNSFLYSKKLINSVQVYESEDYSCIYLKSTKLKTYPVCYDNKGNLIAYYLLNLENFKIKSSSSINVSNDKVNVYSSLANNIFIWKYTGYYYIENEQIKTINFLKNENYKNKNSFQIDNYIITPNYDENNSYKDVYVINTSNGKISNWKLNLNIDYNSYFLGEYDGCGYIVDRKNKLEYKVCPKKKKIETIEGVYLNSGKFEEISLNKLSKTDYKFIYDNLKEYLIKDNKLYFKNKNSEDITLLSERKVDSIITTTSDTVYYISDGSLYLANLKYGEVRLVENLEWNFNSENQIFINKKNL